MKAVLRNGRMVDDEFGLNLLCCLDDCDKRCGLIKECWLSPYLDKQLTIQF